MTSQEIEMFHRNYEYMWNKLNTSHYQVKFDTKTLQASEELREAGELLPSYAICSQCHKPDYVPSGKTIRKVVLFYNQVLRPEVDVWQFLHEDLSQDGAICHRTGSKLDKRLEGLYWGYYITSANSAEVVGAVLRLYEQNGVLHAGLVTGLRSHEEMSGEDLAKVFQETPMRAKTFDAYFASRLSDNDRRCYYFEGTAERSAGSVLLLLHGHSEEARKLVMTLDVSNFSPQQRRAYAGGLAFALSTSDGGPFDARFYQMGLINSIYNYFNIKDERLPKLLKLRTTGWDIRLTGKLDRAWYELAITPKAP